MEEIIKEIGELLLKYDLLDKDEDGEYEGFNVDDVAVAIPWQFREGAERYNDLFDLMNLAVDLKYPTARCVIGKEEVDETFRSIFLDGIKQHLKNELGKKNTKNYQYLHSLVQKSRETTDTPSSRYIHWDDKRFKTLFCLEDRVEAHLKQIGQTYDSMPEQDFTHFVKEELHYLEQHEEIIDKTPLLPLSLRDDAPNLDLDLLKNCLTLLNEPIATRIPITTAKEHVRKIWAWVLGQGVVSEILSQYYRYIMPAYTLPCDTGLDDDDFDGPPPLPDYKIPAGKESVKYLQIPMGTPEYRYVEALFAAYHEPFDNYWDISSPQTISYKEIPVWEDEDRDVNYLVAQYLFITLTGSFFPRPEIKQMIKIGACIYDLLCLLQYRKDDLDFSGETKKGILKKKYDSVKRYLLMDPDTGYYKRII